MNIAVTGAAAGIAAGLIRRLQCLPSVKRIQALDIRQPLGLPAGVEFRQADVRDPGFGQFLKDVDILFHLAFVVAPHPMPPRRVVKEVNVGGSKNVFTAAAAAGVRRVIYLSSISAYGHLPYDGHALQEHEPLRGLENRGFYYARHKAIVEAFLDGFEEQHPATEVVRLRCARLIGPHSSGSFRTNTPDIWLGASRNHGGAFPSQLLYEEDLLDLMEQFIDRPGRGIWNVAADHVPDIRHLQLHHGRLQIHNAGKTMENMVLFIGRFRPAWSWLITQVRGLQLDTRAVQNDLGWQPTIDTPGLLRWQLEGTLDIAGKAS